MQSEAAFAEEKVLAAATGNANSEPVAAAAPPPAVVNDSGGAGGGAGSGLQPNSADPGQVVGNIGAGGSSSSAAAELNNTQPDSYIVTGDEKELDERVRTLLNCFEHDYNQQTLQRGDFWVLQNYVRADHGELKCHESITYTTHADYTFLDNLVPLLER